MLDLSPLSLEETEKYLFETTRVPLSKLSVDLQWALTDIIEFEIGARQAIAPTLEMSSETIALLQSRVDKRLKRFNEFDIGNHFASQIGRFTAGARVYHFCPDPFRSHVTYDAWVEQWGLTSEKYKQLPEFLVEIIYSKFLHGEYGHKTKVTKAQAIVKEIVKDFIGKKLTLQTKLEMQQAIRVALINSKLVDGCRVDISEQNRIVAHVVVDKVMPIQIVTTIGQ